MAYKRERTGRVVILSDHEDWPLQQEVDEDSYLPRQCPDCGEWFWLFQSHVCT